MNKLRLYSKKFYEEAYRFALCGYDIRFSSIREKDDQYLFSPLIFLERHTIELILKSLILFTIGANQNIPYQDIEEIDILDEHGVKINRTLFNTHSLLSLLLFYKYLESQTLCSKCNCKQFKLVERVIRRFEKLDKSSTFFRYPYSKVKNKVVNNERNLVKKIDEKHPLSALQEVQYVLENNTEVQFSVQNLRIVRMEYDLTKAIIELFKLNPWHRDK